MHIHTYLNGQNGSPEMNPYIYDQFFDKNAKINIYRILTFQQSCARIIGCRQTKKKKSPQIKQNTDTLNFCFTPILQYKILKKYETKNRSKLK